MPRSRPAPSRRRRARDERDAPGDQGRAQGEALGRRFVQQDTLDLVLERLRPGGHLLVATDHASYAEHVREQLSQHPRVAVVEGERPAWRPSAGFEDKGRAAGRAIHEFRVTEAG